MSGAVLFCRNMRQFASLSASELAGTGPRRLASVLPTEADMDGFVARFIELYEQSFGEGTAVTEAGVEIMTFHVVATTSHVPLTFMEDPVAGEDPAAAAMGTRRVFFDDGFIATPIFDHRRLAPGNRIEGPALIEGANTTLVVHPDQRITVDGFGNVLVAFPEETV